MTKSANLLDEACLVQRASSCSFGLENRHSSLRGCIRRDYAGCPPTINDLARHPAYTISARLEQNNSDRR